MNLTSEVDICYVQTKWCDSGVGQLCLQMTCVEWCREKYGKTYSKMKTSGQKPMQVCRRWEACWIQKQMLFVTNIKIQMLFVTNKLLDKNLFTAAFCNTPSSQVCRRTLSISWLWPGASPHTVYPSQRSPSMISFLKPWWLVVNNGWYGWLNRFFHTFGIYQNLMDWFTAHEPLLATISHYELVTMN